MSGHSAKLLQQIKQKAKKLKRALVRELQEEIELQQCIEWMCTAYGFRSPEDVHELYPPEGFAFDESISKDGIRYRRRSQIKSLAFDFDIDNEVARRLLNEVRPTALRFSNQTDERTRPIEDSDGEARKR